MDLSTEFNLNIVVGQKNQLLYANFDNPKKGIMVFVDVDRSSANQDQLDITTCVKEVNLKKKTPKKKPYFKPEIMECSAGRMNLAISKKRYSKFQEKTFSISQSDISFDVETTFALNKEPKKTIGPKGINGHICNILFWDKP